MGQAKKRKLHHICAQAVISPFRKHAVWTKPQLWVVFTGTRQRASIEIGTWDKVDPPFKLRLTVPGVNSFHLSPSRSHMLVLGEQKYVTKGLVVVRMAKALPNS